MIGQGPGTDPLEKLGLLKEEKNGKKNVALFFSFFSLALLAVKNLMAIDMYIY